MIDPKELRIGNLAHNMNYANSVDEVKCILSDRIILQSKKEAPPNQLLGLSITEEWLIKLGFEKQNNWAVFYTKGKIGFRLREDKVVQAGLISRNPHGEIGIDIEVNLEYVHRLQNFQFSLTGEELKIG
jgi:hypothetical protein